MRARSDAPREFEVTVERLSHEGRGVARYAGKTVFVADALPGERVLARVTRRHRRFDEAVTQTLLAADPTRVSPRCAHASQCGGCALQHLDPAAQLAHKRDMLLEHLRHQAGTQPVEVLAPITGPLWGYRRRARLSVREVPKKGGVLVGFREKSTHYVTEISRCEVLVPDVGERLPVLKALLDSLSIRAHIPQIEVASDGATTLLAFRHLVPPSAADLARLRDFEAATGLRVMLQDGIAAHSTPLGAAVTLSYRLDDLRLEFLPGDFVQVNAEVNTRLVARALELLAPDGADEVLDLFCGIGNFTLPLARRCRRVLGLEGDAGLVARATANAAANAVANVDFALCDLADPAQVRARARAADLVLLDPPRSGAEATLRGLDLARTQRIVYVSCNPVTLARDAGILVNEREYRLCAAGVIDMFPHTAHVESLAVFERRA
jgi:23S rRNA (uracil1939-C5)-methyltransferase